MKIRDSDKSKKCDKRSFYVKSMHRDSMNTGMSFDV